MFGYVTLYRKGLADAEMDRYQAYYCGLCRTLGRRYGRTGQLALSYDMAFVAILLTALYDTPTAFSEGRCVPHPLKKRPRADNELLDYAADMTAALAYYNFLDDWQDDHRRASLAQAQKLEPSLPALRERWPRQLQTMAAQLDRLNALESAGSHDWTRCATPLAHCWARCSPAATTSGPRRCAAWAMGWGRSSI